MVFIVNGFKIEGKILQTDGIYTILQKEALPLFSYFKLGHLNVSEISDLFMWKKTINCRGAVVAIFPTIRDILGLNHPGPRKCHPAELLHGIRNL